MSADPTLPPEYADAVAQPTPPADPSEATPEEAQQAGQAEAVWLQGQNIGLLQQRCHNLHATLLVSRRRVAELEALVTELNERLQAQA